MADIRAGVGLFEAPATPALGAQVVTGVVDVNGDPFTPKAIVFFFCPDGPYDRALSTKFSVMGFDDGVNACAISTQSQFFVTVPWSSYDASNAYSMVHNFSVFNAVRFFQAKVTAFALGSFTYTISINNFGGINGGSRFAYLALGGDDLRVKVGCVVAPAPTQPITGLGFVPTGVMTAFTYALSPNSSLGGHPGIGLVGTDLTQIANSTGIGEGNTNTLPAQKYQKAGQAVVSVDAWNVTVQNRATVASYDTDGFTFTVPGAASIGYLALGGAQVKVGTITQSLIHGVSSIDLGAGQVAIAALFSSVMGVSSGAIQNGDAWTIGVTDTVRYRSFWETATKGSAQGGSAGASGGDDASIARFYTANGPLSTGATFQGAGVIAEAVEGRLDVGWSGGDGTLREVAYLVLTAPATRVLEPSSVACWNPHERASVGCADDAARPSVGCWSPHVRPSVGCA